MVIAHAAKSAAPGRKENARTTQAAHPRVFIVSDVRLLCDGLVLSLSQQPSLKVAGSADLTAAPTRIAALEPDVVLIDVGSPGGLDIVPVFRYLLPEVKVVAIAQRCRT
jgi:DNA-binding NarL/FixJ family response regulator